ncbi:PLP-dependent aminotransferase family protein [Deinococcus sp. Arct2-2]|uniref:aminotransferase-like domain-containing protein n=1 Tax=Deinococcus sp. Arct2-2 TaxID=2568653 RepID=UPI0010A2BB46|nr:PLP-dependent aminotransferase family protein [Deinococcus sp. Arct2-2]THF71212.1 PLP-dependent aminotransferase family protein [Deinococcus sp. Arct2-2]
MPPAVRSASDRPQWATLLAHWRTGPGPLHTRLTAALRACIHAGHLGPGDALPAERTLAELLLVSRSTVVTAIETLEEEGWVTRRQGSGTHVAATAPRRAEVLTLRSPVPQSQLPKSQPPTGSVQSMPAELDLTIAVPSLTDALRQQLHAASADAFRDSLYYPLGMPELRAHLAAQYTQNGLPTTPEQVIITSGAQQAISVIASVFLRRGDVALLETPTYFGAIDVFRATGATLLGVPVTPDGVQADAFADALRTGAPRLAFLTPTFQNPTGTVLPAHARERLAAQIMDAGLPTIEDDTLIDLSFSTDRLPPRLSAYAPEGQIINVGSLSKLYWAGLRVGWLRAPQPLLAQLAQAKTLADFGSSSPSQAIALNLLADLPGLRQARSSSVTPARDLLVRLLREHLPDWSFTVPAGGQFLWVELPTPHVTAFTLFAHSYGVRLFPGASMGVEPLPDSFLRIPFTLPTEHLPEAVRRLAQAWQAYRARGGAARLA